MKILLYFLSSILLISQIDQQSDIHHSSLQPKKEIKELKVNSRIYNSAVPWMEANDQTSNIKYFANTFWGPVFVTNSGEINYKFKVDSSNYIHFKEIFLGANDNTILAKSPSETVVNFFKGNNPEEWQKHVSAYDNIQMGEVWEGIEVELKAHNGYVEKLFYVNPGSDPSVIEIQMEGIMGLDITDDGEIIVSTAYNDIILSKPIAYQIFDNERHEVEISYKRVGNIYGFKIGNYCSDQTLFIDPLIGSTYIGGNDYDVGNSILVNDSGNVIVCGWTLSNNFPIIDPAIDSEIDDNNGGDAFVSIFSSDLHTLIASTFLGGSQSDLASSIILDDSSNIIIAGRTSSEEFPIINPTIDGLYNGRNDAFVIKLSPDIGTIKASTFLGGEYDDEASEISLDDSGNVYICGFTQSSDFPTTDSAFDKDFNGGDFDGFTAKLSPNLDILLASTYLGGKSDDFGLSIAHNDSGFTYVTGYTGSSDFPITGNTFDSLYNGTWDMYITKFSQDLEEVVASTFVGGNDMDIGRSLAIDYQENIVITGQTSSPNYPVTSFIYDNTIDGNGDAFVSIFEPNLKQILASTFIGGSGHETGFSLVLDSNSIFIGGSTTSPDFPTTYLAYDRSFSGAGTYSDVMVFRISNDLKTLLASTFIGGNSLEECYDIARDKTGNLYLIGYTSSTDFPIVKPAFNHSMFGYSLDAFVLKIDENLSRDQATLKIDEEKCNIRIFPNPTNKYIYVDYEKDFLLKIYNSSGNIQFTANKKMVDLSSLSSGIYIVKIFNKNDVLLKSEKIMLF